MQALNSSVKSISLVHPWPCTWWYTPQASYTVASRTYVRTSVTVQNNYRIFRHMTRGFFPKNRGCGAYDGAVRTWTLRDMTSTSSQKNRVKILCIHP
jgi:hypothetical protein